MRIPLIFFGIAILFVTFFLKTRRSADAQLESYSRYLDEEQSANFSRRRDPGPEDYLVVDIESLPMHEYPDTPEYGRVRAKQQVALELAQLPMMCENRGLSNRELKLKYGSANLDMIITYEENYNSFIHELLEWASALISIDEADAQTVLQAAINYRCDRSQAYTMMADIYAAHKDIQALSELAALAEEMLDSSAKKRALGHIKLALENF